MAESAHTSDATVPWVASDNTSGADHGIDRPTASIAALPRVDAEMPKSESTGAP